MRPENYWSIKHYVLPFSAVPRTIRYLDTVRWEGTQEKIPRVGVREEQEWRDCCRAVRAAGPEPPWPVHTGVWPPRHRPRPRPRTSAAAVPGAVFIRTPPRARGAPRLLTGWRSRGKDNAAGACCTHCCTGSRHRWLLRTGCGRGPSW
jgi:hypothetical protein